MRAFVSMLALAPVAGAACTRAADREGERKTGAAAADPPVRAVSLHDVTTEIVVALGATDLLVAVADAVDQPVATVAATARIPRADGIESIVAAQPTLVLGMAVIEQRAPDLVRRLRDRRTDVVLGDPHTLDDVFALVRDVAARLGRPAAGGRLVARLRGELPPTPAPTSGRAAAPRTFVYDCCDPAFTAGGRTVLSDLVRRAGGRNVFGDLDVSWTKVPWETVIARRPQLIVIDDYDMSGQGDVAAKRAQLAAIPSLAVVPTVVMPLGEALGGIRSVAGLRRLAAAIAALPAQPGQARTLAATGGQASHHEAAP